MRRIVLAVLGLLVPFSVAGAPAPFVKFSRFERIHDLERLQGKWEMIRTITRKGRVSTHDPAELIMVIKGNRLRCDILESHPEPCTFRINPASSPKRLELDYNDAFTGVPEKDRAALIAAHGGASYLYRLTGDRLTLRFCFGEPDDPTDLDTPHQGNTSDVDIMTFKRKK